MKDEELHGERILERLRLKNLAGKKNLIEDLKKRKSQRSVSLLVEMLEDESWYLREQAVKALADAGEEAKEPVLKVLEDGLWYARAAAAKVLGRIGGPAAVLKLTDCLLDSNMTVQGAAAAALVDIAKRSTVDDLAQPLSTRPHDVRQKAIACLSLLDKEIADGVLGCWERAVAGRASESVPEPHPTDEEQAER
jgi:HEAT repeat protein